MKTLRAVLAATLLTLALPAGADPQADADYIVEQTMTREIFEGAIAAQRPLIVGALENDLRSQGITLSDKERFFDLFLEEFIEEFTASMRSQSAVIYLDAFTPEDLAAIAEFYRTPAGQALLAETPALMMKGAEMGAEAGGQAGLNAAPRLAERLEREGITVTTDPAAMDKLLDTLR